MKPNSCGKLALPDFICNTSPFQYLHQLGCLEILPALAGRIIVPHAVQEELQIGLSQGCDVPDLTRLAWVTFRNLSVPQRFLSRQTWGAASPLFSLLPWNPNLRLSFSTTAWADEQRSC